MLALLLLLACGQPCPAHDGSVDGYCDGQTAWNCVTTCADCIDQWKSVACTGTCATSSTPPTEVEMGGTPPNMSDPASWAVCSEWTASTTP